MGQETKIQWCDHTWNPWRGCVKISPGCANCYAEAGSHRNPKVLGEWGPKGKRAIAAESYWDLPRRWNLAAEKADERRRVFCLSLGDVFEAREELIEPRARLFEIIRQTPYLDWLLLTKRPEAATTILRDHLFAKVDRGLYSAWELLTAGELPNVWLGVSVEDRARTSRIEVLRQIPAAVRFLSLEPLLEDLGRLDLSGIDWVIVGGESGPNARPCNYYWIQSIVRQCHAAGVACFVKQWGSRPFFDGTGGCRYDDHIHHKLRDKKGGDPNEWPYDLRVREFPR